MKLMWSSESMMLVERDINAVMDLLLATGIPEVKRLWVLHHAGFLTTVWALMNACRSSGVMVVALTRGPGPPVRPGGRGPDRYPADLARRKGGLRPGTDLAAQTPSAGSYADKLCMLFQK